MRNLSTPHPHLNGDLSAALSSRLAALNGCERAPLRSPECVLRSACRIVSIWTGSSSPDAGFGLPRTIGEVGLAGDRVRARSACFGEAAPLVVGGEDAADLTGEADRFAVDDRLINCRASFDVTPNTSCLSCSTCSACTTSAKEMKLKRRGSAVSSEPYPGADSVTSAWLEATDSV
jgi:hypothetical protein